jgi:signal transduction histidine kinase
MSASDRGVAPSIDSATGKAPQDKGLGLIIAGEIVQTYGGTISFAPASGSGLAVGIELPCP